jgi:hypothetical protein
VVAKVMAVVVALFLLGGVAQAAGFHAATSTAVVLDDASLDVSDLGDVVVPVEPVQTVAPIRQAIVIVMPSLAPPIASAFAPRTFRPPRG